MCFVPASSYHRSPTVAILHIDPYLRRRLVVRHFDLIEKELSTDDAQVFPDVDSRASLLVPVNGLGHGDDGGILVVGGSSCEYIPLKDSASATPGKQVKDLKGKATSPEVARKKRVRGGSTTSLTAENKCLKTDIPLADVTA